MHQNHVHYLSIKVNAKAALQIYCATYTNKLHTEISNKYIPILNIYTRINKNSYE